MNNLSQECKNLINHLSEERATRLYDPNSEHVSGVMECTEWSNRAHNYAQGMSEALTNPTIYQSAGLMTVEEALRFEDYRKSNEWFYNSNANLWSNPSTCYDYAITTTELLTIFRNQNQEK